MIFAVEAQAPAIRRVIIPTCGKRNDVITALEAKGWKQAKYPQSESCNIYATEHERRSLDYKWEPIVRRAVRKRADSFPEPFLVSHAIPRHGAARRLTYAAVVTISTTNFAGDRAPYSWRSLETRLAEIIVRPILLELVALKQVINRPVSPTQLIA
jgi:hypothetical protein